MVSSVVSVWIRDDDSGKLGDWRRGIAIECRAAIVRMNESPKKHDGRIACKKGLGHTLTDERDRLQWFVVALMQFCSHYLRAGLASHHTVCPT